MNSNIKLTVVSVGCDSNFVSSYFEKKEEIDIVDYVSVEEKDSIGDVISFLNESNSDYVCFFDKDEVRTESFYDNMICLLEQNAQVDVACGLFLSKEKYGEIIHPISTNVVNILKNKIFAGKDLLETFSDSGEIILGVLGSILVRTTYFRCVTELLDCDLPLIINKKMLFNSIISKAKIIFSTEEVYAKLLVNKMSIEKSIEQFFSDEKILTNIKKEMTFFYTDKGERYNLEPIAVEAQRRGYSIIFTEDIKKKAEIGVYCQHVCFPENSKFSVVLLHDMAQGHNRWPNLWCKETWNKFDIGVLPCEIWKDMWERCACMPYVRPRYGAYMFGYPKSDLVKDVELQNRIKELKDKFSFKYKFTVLYAPSWENDEKEDDFVRALVSLPVNLIIKQASWNPVYSEIIENIRVMRNLHEGKYENVYYIEPEESIMVALGLCDVIVSEESSVMAEAAMFNIPAVSVYDWLIPDTNPKRFASVPMDWQLKIKRVELRETIEKLMNDKEFYSYVTSLGAGIHVNSGNVCRNIMDAIDYYTGVGENKDFMKHRGWPRYKEIQI